jgi:hypothetical protein
VAGEVACHAEADPGPQFVEFDVDHGVRTCLPT